MSEIPYGMGQIPLPPLTNNLMYIESQWVLCIVVSTFAHIIIVGDLKKIVQIHFSVQEGHSISIKKCN